MSCFWIAIISIWAGGTLPIMAGAAAKPEGCATTATLSALLWPLLVGWVLVKCMNNDRR